MDAWLAVKWRRLLGARSMHPRGGIINSRLGPRSLSNPFTFTHDDASSATRRRLLFFFSSSFLCFFSFFFFFFFLFASKSSRAEPRRDASRGQLFYSFYVTRPLPELITLRINHSRQCMRFPISSLVPCKTTCTDFALFPPFSEREVSSAAINWISECRILIVTYICAYVVG